MERRGNERKIESEEKEKGGETTCIAAVPSAQQLLKIAQNLRKYLFIILFHRRLIISRITGCSF